ncbi:hypothetical protein G6F35_009472 [Rhizopus arrhizus]|nr:hypothetical protein G6F35_009472 [Rhizopus arrhizus]
MCPSDLAAPIMAAVQRLRRRGWRAAGLVALPIAIGAVGQRAKRRHAAVHGDLAADLAGLLAAHQQPQGARAQRAAAQSGQERALAARAARRTLHAVGRVGQQALARLQQLIKKLSGAHVALFCLCVNADRDIRPPAPQ